MLCDGCGREVEWVRDDCRDLCPDCWSGRTGLMTWEEAQESGRAKLAEIRARVAAEDAQKPPEDEQEALRRFARATAPPKETVADRYYKARRAAGRHRGKKRRSA